MATTVYLLCAVTSSACAVLLIREYRRSRLRLLLWSSVAFVGLACNNALVFADFVLIPQYDLAVMRAAVALASLMLLLYAFVWEQA
jgi:cytochrome bd-type quinol oxidase subunit 2